MGTQTTRQPSRKVEADNVKVEGQGRMGKGRPGLPPRGTGLKAGFKAGQSKPLAEPPTPGTGV
jgi:hypothetical protein